VRIEQAERGTSLRFDRIRFAGRSFEAPIYYGYRIARAIPRTRGLFVGGELIHAKAYADGSGVSGAGAYEGAAVQALPFPAVVQRLAMSHGLNFLLANVGVRRPLGNCVTGTATVGAGPMVPHVEVQLDGITRETYQLAGIGMQAAVGAEVRTWRRLSVLTEYKWTRAAVRLALDPGRAELTASSHHLAVGLSAAF
jgi:hypothetical protein